MRGVPRGYPVRTADPVLEVTVHHPHSTYGRSGQVFGLVGSLTGDTGHRRAPTGRRFPDPNRIGPSAVDGFRSHSPLRDSPGFPPGSLLRRAT